MSNINHILYRNEEGIDSRQVGFLSVVNIVEYQPTGKGDKLYYDIIHKDGTVYRVFEPIMVVFDPPAKNDSEGSRPR